MFTRDMPKTLKGGGKLKDGNEYIPVKRKPSHKMDFQTKKVFIDQCSSQEDTILNLYLVIKIALVFVSKTDRTSRINKSTGKIKKHILLIIDTNAKKPRMCKI